MERPIPDYGVRFAPPPFRKKVVSIALAVVLTVGFLVLVAVMAFRPLPPAPLAPGVAPGTGNMPATTPPTAD